MGGGTEGNTTLGGGTRAPATAAGGGSLPASWLGGCQVAGHPGVCLLGVGGLGPYFLPLQLIDDCLYCNVDRLFPLWHLLN